MLLLTNYHNIVHFASNTSFVELLIRKIIWYRQSEREEDIMGTREMLGTTTFSFTHDVFKMLFPLERQTSSLCGKGLTLSQTTNFRLLQTEGVCR